MDFLLRRSHFHPPQTFFRGMNILHHVEKLDRYFKDMKVDDEETRIDVLFDHVSEEVKFELQGHRDFSNNQKNWEWIRNKLVELNREKSTEISPIARLMAMQQGDQDTREFCRNIRIEGARLFRETNSIDREEFLVKAFVFGLRSKSASLALQALKPKTLDDALKFVKKESAINSIGVQQEENIRLIQPPRQDSSRISELQNAVSNMQAQIAELKALVMELRTDSKMDRSPNNSPVRNYNPGGQRRPGEAGRTYADMVAGRNTNRRSTPVQEKIQCYACHEFGHIARYCNQKLPCAHCGMRNHQTQYCRQRQQQSRDSGKLRHFVEVDGEAENPEISGTLAQNTQSDLSSVDEQEDYAHLRVIRVSKPVRPNVVIPRCKGGAETREVTTLANFVNGHAALPRKYRSSSRTVITKADKELAKNKPLVNCNIGKQNVKTLLDTGAEANIIDSSCLESLKHKDDETTFIRRPSFVTCANGSKMPVIGIVFAVVKLGEVSSRQKFLVVNSLIPRAIIGIRTMKQMNVLVDPANNCIHVGPDRIKFISHIENPCTSGNGQLSA